MTSAGFGQSQRNRNLIAVSQAVLGQSGLVTVGGTAALCQSFVHLSQLQQEKGTCNELFPA